MRGAPAWIWRLRIGKVLLGSLVGGGPRGSSTLICSSGLDCTAQIEPRAEWHTEGARYRVAKVDLQQLRGAAQVRGSDLRHQVRRETEASGALRPNERRGSVSPLLAQQQTRQREPTRGRFLTGRALLRGIEHVQRHSSWRMPRSLFAWLLRELHAGSLYVRYTRTRYSRVL